MYNISINLSYAISLFIIINFIYLLLLTLFSFIRDSFLNIFLLHDDSSHMHSRMWVREMGGGKNARKRQVFFFFFLVAILFACIQGNGGAGTGRGKVTLALTFRRAVKCFVYVWGLCELWHRFSQRGAGLFARGEGVINRGCTINEIGIEGE